MPRVFIVSVAVAATAVLLEARQDPAFRARVHTVSLYATVVDRAGRLVPDLTREDFEVFDNGKRQELTVFTNELQPITVVIMLDRSRRLVGEFDLVQGAAEQFIGHLLGGDKARAGSFGGRIQIEPADFTGDKDELLRIVRESLQEAGPAPLWNATASAMTALKGQEGRRVVLVFTDGPDRPTGRGTNVSFKDVRDRAKAEDIMVYAVGLSGGCDPFDDEVVTDSSEVRFQGRGRAGRGRGRPAPGARGRGGARPPLGRGRSGPARPTPGIARPRPGPCVATKPDPDLKALATDGGGGYFELNGAGNLASTFARVADELHHQYLLAFTAAKLDGKTHSIEVRMRRQDLAARTRKGYVATPSR